jgi:hypothetical protein
MKCHFRGPRIPSIKRPPPVGLCRIRRKRSSDIAVINVHAIVGSACNRPLIMIWRFGGKNPHFSITCILSRFLDYRYVNLGPNQSPLLMRSLRDGSTYSGERLKVTSLLGEDLSDTTPSRILTLSPIFIDSCIHQPTVITGIYRHKLKIRNWQSLCVLKSDRAMQSVMGVM